ncbi:MAG: hypothetical protein U1E36_01205 [Rickettsiales bacterium]
MKKDKIILAVAVLTVLTACDDNRYTRVHVPGTVDVEAGSYPTKSGGHCPPGHAKKGWC